MSEKKGNKSCFSCFMISLIVILILIALPLWYTYDNLKFTNESEVSVVIDEGAGLEEISTELLSKKVIKSDVFFQAYTFYSNEYSLFQPGEYVIPKGSTVNEVTGILKAVQATEVTLTFPEGSTTSEIFTILAANTSVSENDLYTELNNPMWNNEIPIKNESANTVYEGFIFPDTYIFNIDTTAQEIIQKFIDNFNQKWAKASDNQTYLDDYDILILASIIEKESAKSDERRIVSGILHDRLTYVIHLGVNATLNYVLDEPKAFFDNEDLATESDYNTYLNFGLPPTPVCNPGLDSMNAALNPEYTQYVYYLHTPEGEIKYSVTLDEHNQNISKYY